MNKCTESTEGWPDAPGDVSSDAEEAFLVHVAHCPFHAKALHAEIENTRSIFRRARGVNAHGRILTGRELRQTIADQDRRYILWEEIVEESIVTFRRIYLGNRGEDIVCSGHFFDFRNYDGDHRLDPIAGLQILAVVGEGKETLDVLLGYYPLFGVKHTGNEQFLSLKNGFTIGLRVTQLSDRDFNIRFRCVENEVLTLEKMGIMMHPYNQPAPVHGAAMLLSWTRGTVQSLGHSLRIRVKLRKLVSLILHGPSTPVDVLEWGLITAMIFFVALTGMVSFENFVGRAFANEFEFKSPIAVIEQKLDKPRGRSGNSTTPPSTGVGGASNSNQKSSTAGSVSRPNQIGDEHLTPTSIKLPAPDPKTDSRREEVNNIGPAAWYFQSLSPAGMTQDQVAIHTGSDADLVKKLTAEMLKQDVCIRPVTRGSLARRHVSVSWKIIRQQTGVTVEAAILTANGDSKPVYGHGVGNCPEQACDEAVRNAVSKVFAAMKDLSHNESTNSE